MAMTLDEMYMRLLKPAASMASLPKDVPTGLGSFVENLGRSGLVLAAASPGLESATVTDPGHVVLIGDRWDDKEQSPRTAFFIETAFHERPRGSRFVDAFLLDGSEGLCDAGKSLAYTEDLRLNHPRESSAATQLMQDHAFSWEKVCKMANGVRDEVKCEPGDQSKQRKTLLYLELQPRAPLNRRVLLVPDYSVPSRLLAFWRDNKVVEFIDNLGLRHTQMESGQALRRFYDGSTRIDEQRQRREYLDAWQARDRHFTDQMARCREQGCPVRFLVHPLHIASGYLTSLLEERGMPYVAFSPSMPEELSPRELVDSL